MRKLQWRICVFWLHGETFCVAIQRSDRESSGWVFINAFVLTMIPTLGCKVGNLHYCIAWWSRLAADNVSCIAADCTTGPGHQCRRCTSDRTQCDDCNRGNLVLVEWSSMVHDQCLVTPFQSASFNPWTWHDPDRLLPHHWSGLPCVRMPSVSWLRMQELSCTWASHR